MTSSLIRTVPTWLALVLSVGACQTADVHTTDSPSGAAVQTGPAMGIQYLEVVTPEVDATCDALATMHGVTFGDPIAGFGNARTAALTSGGRLGVRAPMAAHEQPLVRPYVLVDDIEAAVAVAQDAGAEIALPPMEIPGEGMFAIYILGGIQHGLWQL